MKTRCYGSVLFSFSYNRANFEEKQGPGWLGMRNSMITLSFGGLRFRLQLVVILGVQGPWGLHGRTFLILISRRFAFFKRLISAKPECSQGGGGRVGVSIFFCMRGLAPSIYLSPPKVSGILSTQKIFYPSLRIHENIRVPPPQSVLA